MAEGSLRERLRLRLREKDWFQIIVEINHPNFKYKLYSLIMNAFDIRYASA